MTRSVVQLVGSVLVGSLGASSLACGSESGSARSDASTEAAVEAEAGAAFDRAQLLEAAATCAMSRYERFVPLAEALATRTAELAAEPSSAERKTAARTAYADAMAAWQEAELFRFGPAAAAVEPGGRDLRDEIYGWPVVGRCRIDEQLVSRAYAEPTFSTTLLSGRTLAALDYLLYVESPENGCGSTSAINARGTWAALDESELERRRAEYAAVVTALVVEKARALVDAWSPSGGNFRADWLASGTGGETFMNVHAATNALCHALFYLEREVKDLKLGRPLGLYMCESGACAEAIESPHSGLSKENLAANLVGFRRLFLGCGDDGAGVGFDDWLGAVGAEDLSARMTSALATLESDVEALDAPLDALLRDDPDRVRATHTALKGVTDLLKTEFVSVLNHELPMGAEGDND